MRKRRLAGRRWVLAGGVALFATLAQGQQTGTPGGLIPDGATPAIDVLYTGDVIGFVDPCG